ncbi:ABC transporter permease [Rhodococcus rhodochrous]|uniref:ABC transporter permease n=1 Tax=Rhodococcus rhodochrous TaxID=1829 RepID=UPI0011AB94A3|nr:ABC transporter permease [Rhodococcus rhodochrous]TWH44410.1 simple sugar transport system permease protein [Rhodococcus rhodochrous J38]
MITIILAGAIATGTAILLPALGELITERAGITNLGTEGAMLGGALAGVMLGIKTGSPWLGILGAIVIGALVSALFAWSVVIRRANQLAAGLIIWFLMLGLTSVIGRSYNGQVLDPIGTLAIPLLSEIPVLGPILFDQSPLVYLGYILIGVIGWVLARTRVGLKVRATGERPLVVAAAGSQPHRIQLLATVIGGGLAGLGGAYLSVGTVGNWSTDMTNGYGFVAVAVVMFSAWRVSWVTVGSVLFGAAIVTASQLQAHGFAINQYLLDALPYVLTLVILVVISARRTSQPEALRAALAPN